MVNVKTEEHLYTKQFYQDTYEKYDVMNKAYDGFDFPSIGSSTLPVEVGKVLRCYLCYYPYLQPILCEVGTSLAQFHERYPFYHPLTF